jgi:phosphatidylglycerophosphatase A
VPAIFALGLATSWRAEAFYGHDGSRIVIDEVVGQAVTLMGHPATGATFIVGFLLFRFFDVLKPFPVGRMQRLKGGAGVMADDLAAGIYANLALWILLAASWPTRPA